MQHRVSPAPSALGRLRRRQLVWLAQQAAGTALLGSPSRVIRHEITIVDIRLRIFWMALIPLSHPKLRSSSRGGEVLVGDLPSRALKLVAEWATLHRGELETD